MSRIDDLINLYAPNGVEHERVGDVGTLYNGLTGKSKADFSGGNARYASYMNVYTNMAVDVCPDDLVQVGEEERQNRVRYGDVLFTTSSENLDEVGLASAVTEEPPEPLLLNSFCFGLRPSAVADLDPAFSKHLFRSAGLRNQIVRTANGVTRINISKERFREIKVPVPHPEIQREIARILDAFAAMTSSLQDEIALRQEQYAAISQRLFMQAAEGTDGNDVARVRIGEVAKRCVRPEVLEPEKTYACLGVKWYGAGVYLRETRLGDEIKAKTLNRVKAGQFLYNRMFVTEGSFAVVPPESEGGVVSNEFPIYDLDESRVLPGWLRLSVLDEFALKRIEAETTGVERGSMKSRRRWKEDRFEAFMIDLPSVAVQRRVLHTLDVLNAFQESLDEELQARRQQYAYYRDRLLTFEEAAE